MQIYNGFVYSLFINGTRIFSKEKGPPSGNYPPRKYLG